VFRRSTLLSPATRRRRRLLVTAGIVIVLTGLISPARSAAAPDPCGPPVASVIACENSKPGTPESDWRVGGSGDATIQGYATSMSVNIGQTVSFKISTPASSYHLDILRMGYYQGNGARKVAANVLPTAGLPQSQPACLSDAATGLVDCGNWAVSASWAVPATAVSGIYLAHLVRNDTGGGSVIPFVVRDDGSHSQLLVQTSDTTWQAYNTYGGNSLYSCTLCPPGNPQGYKGAFKVSYNRPFHSADDDAGRSWLMYAEYPMVRFLEANGYDTSYTSGLDIATRGPLIVNHTTFLSVGHDEYWSGEQRANIEAARTAGVNLAFFSGNEMFWKTRWEPSIAAGATANRTLVTYKETHFNAPPDPLDPPTWTGTWRDPRFSPPADGQRPENSVTGQFFLVNSGTTDIKVPAQYKNLRFWRNTAVAGLAAGQTATLGPGVGTLGYEWDEDADNGFRPRGIFQLSATTSATAEVFTDYGSSVASPRGATHHLTLYKAGSALVFGAGTVQWSWGLDAANPSGRPVDVTMQQATVNLFADMGAQPFALIPGLTAATPSADGTAPSSTIAFPAAGANLADGARITVSGTATDGGGVVAGVEVSTDGGTTWHPATGTTSWSYSWVVHGSPTATVQSRPVDDSGNVGATASINVNVSCPCSIWGTNVTPAGIDSGDSGSLEVGIQFKTDTAGTVSALRFYKAVTNIGVHIGNLWTGDGQLIARGTFTNETASGWQELTFNPAIPVNASTTYVASYFAPAGHYSQESGYMFGAPSPMPDGNGSIDSAPLHAYRNSAGVINDLYSYSAGTTFPTSTYNGENYWVDVVFGGATPPGQPTNVVATAGTASAGLSWSAPATGGAVSSYVITPYIGSTAQPTTTVTGTPAPTSASVTGLTNGTTYTFTVTARNSAGAGPASAPSNPVTPSAGSSGVQNGGFESGLNFWTAAGGNPPAATTGKAHSGTGSAVLGFVSGQEIAGESILSQTVTVPTGASTLNFWYWPVTADALCSGANCQWDYQEAQLRTTGGATLATVFKGNSNAQAWTPVSFDTSAYAGQTVVAWFHVHSDGAMPPDDTAMYLDDVSVTGSQPTAPGTPTNVTAVPGNAQATLSWTAPGDGGSPITSYTVTPFIGSTAQPPVTITGSPPATGTTVTGLTNGTTYTFTVRATNAIGTSPASAASNAVTPSAAPPPAFVQRDTGHGLNKTSQAVTPTGNITAGNRIVVEVGIWNSSHASARTVTDAAGNTYTKVLGFVASDGTEQSIWTAPITAGGGTRPVVTVTPTSPADVGVAVLEYSGLSPAAGAAVVDRTVTNSGTTTSPTTVSSGATAATTAGNELAVGFYCDSGFGTTPVAGGGWTPRATIAGVSDMDLLVQDAIVAQGGTPGAAASTGGNTVWLMSTVVFKHA
jgi:hypothetical protein